MMYKITITTKSDTLFASSEGSAIIDSITRYDKYGLPYIPAKTLKGLLRESAQEVDEITGLASDLIEKIFGLEGKKTSSSLNFDDAKIVGYSGFKQEIENSYNLETSVENQIKSAKDKFYHYSPKEALSHFTTIRHQTAMDDGVARPGSLRTYCCLKPDLKFELSLDLDIAHFGYFNKVCKNLRRAGSNRNRGYGKIDVKLDVCSETVSVKNRSKVTKSVLKINLLTPALLPTRSGDANTVSSETIISGRKILGMLASEYIKINFKEGKNANGKEPHEDLLFKDLFLNGKVFFSDAYPISNDQICFPLGNHWVKPKQSNVAFNDFETNPKENYKGLGGYVSFEGDKKASVSTVLDFHNSRNKQNQGNEKGHHTRLKGSNSGNGIYYYESLVEGLEYAFKLECDKTRLEAIHGLINTANDLRIGKSVSTALGKVEITDFDGTWPEINNIEKDNKYLLTFISPVILKDRFGEYLPSIESLTSYLNGIQIDAKDARLRTIKIQVFQGAISMQFPEMMAIAAGSSFVVKGSNISEIKSIGEFRHEGYGQFIIEEYYGDKKEELSKLLNRKERIELKGITEIEIFKKEESSFEKYLQINREVKIAANDGSKKGSKLHKNTTKRMLDLCREIQYKSVGNNFENAVEIAIHEELEKSPYSIKIIEEIIELLNLSDGRDGNKFSVLRKKNISKFKTDFKEEMVRGINVMVKNYKTKEAKLAYLIAYFNKTKIVNRND